MPVIHAVTHKAAWAARLSGCRLRMPSPSPSACCSSAAGPRSATSPRPSSTSSRLPRPCARPERTAPAALCRRCAATSRTRRQRPQTARSSPRSRASAMSCWSAAVRTRRWSSRSVPGEPVAGARAAVGRAGGFGGLLPGGSATAVTSCVLLHSGDDLPGQERQLTAIYRTPLPEQAPPPETSP